MPQELRERGMTVSGRKEDLATRLLDSMKVARQEVGMFDDADGRSYEEVEQEVELAENLKPGDVEFLTVRPAAEVSIRASQRGYSLRHLRIVRPSTSARHVHGMPDQQGCSCREGLHRVHRLPPDPMLLVLHLT
jgi:hypothetical protein